MAANATKITYNEGSAPSTPAAAKVVTYAKADGLMYSKDDAGVETLMSSGGSGSVATDAIWDAAGDLAVGSGANTAAKLALGTAGLALVSNGSTVVYGKPYGSLLAVVQNTAGGNKSTTSSTQADVDSSNALITFTAPASGNVLVKATVTGNIGTFNQNAFLGIRESTTDVVNKTFAMQGQTATALEPLIFWTAYITGVSAGSHTYKLAFAVNGGVTFTLRSSAANPMILEVWSCP